jgi:cytoskeletal protein CcmA (bactofilin family)
MKKSDVHEYACMLGKDSRIEGNKISTITHLKISGSVQMNIDCDGKLVITESGSVSGNIKAKEIVVFGSLDGNVWVTGSITICKSADVSGFISAASLKVEENATCHFDARIDTDSKTRFEHANLDSNPATGIEYPRMTRISNSENGLYKNSLTRVISDSLVEIDANQSAE